MLSGVRIKRHFPLVGPLVYDVKIMTQVIGGYYKIIYYRKKYGVISKKSDIRFDISFKVVDINKK